MYMRPGSQSVDAVRRRAKLNDINLQFYKVADRLPRGTLLVRCMPLTVDTNTESGRVSWQALRDHARRPVVGVVFIPSVYVHCSVEGVSWPHGWKAHSWQPSFCYLAQGDTLTLHTPRPGRVNLFPLAVDPKATGRSRLSSLYLPAGFAYPPEPAAPAILTGSSPADPGPTSSA